MYLNSNFESTISIYLTLSDVDTYTGGEIVIDKIKIDEEKDDGYDEDEEEEDEEEHIYTHTKETRKKKEVDEEEVNAYYSVYDTLNADKGCMMIVPSHIRHGLKPLVEGKKDILKIELWPFANAPLSTRMASLDEARPLERSKEEF